LSAVGIAALSWDEIGHGSDRGLSRDSVLKPFGARCKENCHENV
jgi:hypothetical protein